MKNQINVKDIYKSTSNLEQNEYLKDKITKLIIKQFSSEAKKGGDTM